MSLAARSGPWLVPIHAHCSGDAPIGSPLASLNNADENLGEPLEQRANMPDTEPKPRLHCEQSRRWFSSASRPGIHPHPWDS